MKKDTLDDLLKAHREEQKDELVETLKRLQEQNRGESDQCETLFEGLFHADMYKRVLEETRERSLKMIEDTEKRRKLHGKTEVFNEVQESGKALITSVDESLLNLARVKQQALQLIETLDDNRFKATTTLEVHV